MKNLSLMLFCSLFLLCCQSEDEVQVVKAGQKFSMTLPAFLYKVDTLNREASLQYQNEFKEFYVLVFDEPREEIITALRESGMANDSSKNLNLYADILFKNFEEGVDIAMNEGMKETVIFGNPARTMNLEGKSAGVDAFFSIAYIEGKKRFYQIVIWTLKDRREKYEEKMRQILMSLKEG